ncbi:MAG TPA: phage holin family protein [Pseudonocardia sp.]|jgi:hypothetical protein
MTTDPDRGSTGLPAPAQPGTRPGNPDATASLGDPALSEMSGQVGTPSVFTPASAPEPAPAPTSAGASAATAPDLSTATPRHARPEPTRPDPAARSTGDLVRTLTEQVRSLVRGEVASAQQEMAEKARAAQPAAGMLGGAAALGALAAGTSAVVVVRFFDKIFPPLTSAVVATGVLGGVAAALARAGAEELKRVGPPVPERTIESVKADVAAVTEATPR